MPCPLSVPLQALHSFYSSHPDRYRNASIKAFMTAYEAGKRGVQCGHETDHQANCFAKVACLPACLPGCLDADSWLSCPGVMGGEGRGGLCCCWLCLVDSCMCAWLTHVCVVG